MANRQIGSHELSNNVPSKLHRDGVEKDNDNTIVEHFDNAEQIANLKSETPQMRLNSDDLGIWESVVRHKFITLVAMAAAFSASLDGYRKQSFEQNL